MQFNEYTIMSNAFESAFRAMLNRLIDAEIITGYPTEEKIANAEDQCWNELCVAFEQAGLSFNRTPE